MPVATIGLFALALVVVALAFGVSKLVDNSGTAAISPQDVLSTQAAQKTQSAAGSGAQTQVPTKVAGSATPSASQTATNKTPGATTAAGGTYTVVSGDFCGAIADAHGITLQQLLTANNMTEGDCNTLKVGQVLKLK